MIIFENIDTGETFGISREVSGKYYRAMLSAIVNSSNMSVNADRGQDFGYRLIPEQQALIEEWERDPHMIDKVSTWSKVMIDDLSHSEFLAYLLYQQELGMSPEKSQDAERRNNQREYEARVAALKSDKKATMPAFEPKIAREDATVEDFLRGDITGDAGGDKVVEDEDGADEGDAPEAPVLEPVTVGADKTIEGDDKSVETPVVPKTTKKPSKK